jgi:hypothetical protein
MGVAAGAALRRFPKLHQKPLLSVTSRRMKPRPAKSRHFNTSLRSLALASGGCMRQLTLQRCTIGVIPTLTDGAAVALAIRPWRPAPKQSLSLLSLLYARQDSILAPSKSGDCGSSKICRVTKCHRRLRGGSPPSDASIAYGKLGCHF